MISRLLLIKHWFTCLLVFLRTFPNQLHLRPTLHFLDCHLPLHRRLSIWQFLHIHELYGAARPGIACATPLVVHRDTFFRVDGPTSVIGPIRAFHNMTITAHLTYVVFGDPWTWCPGRVDSYACQRWEHRIFLRLLTNPPSGVHRTSEPVLSTHFPTVL